MRWLTVRKGRRKRRKDFLKLHFIVDCRSLAETAVSVVKGRFSHTVYSKKRRAQKNELSVSVPRPHLL